MSDKEETGVPVAPDEAAIVFHAEGPPSVYMPELDDDVLVGNHVMTALAVFHALEDEELRALITARFEASLDRVERDG